MRVGMQVAVPVRHLVHQAMFLKEIGVMESQVHLPSRSEIEHNARQVRSGWSRSERLARRLRASARQRELFEILCQMASGRPAGTMAT
jgi:hypothetical protein